MSNTSCPVHDNFYNCFTWRLERLKVAIACAVLRNKPPNQTIRDFLNNLRHLHLNKEERWKDEYHRLQQEVLQLRQQLLLLTTNQSGNDTQSRTYFLESQHLDECIQPSNLLTPPNSQPLDSQSTTQPFPHSASTSNVETQKESDHTEFLRAYFYIEHQLRAQKKTFDKSQFRISENDVICRSVFTLLRHIKQSMTSSDPTFKMYLNSLRVCLQLLDSHSKWIPAIRDEVAQMASEWLDYLQSKQSTRAFSMLVVLTESDEMAVNLAEFLANRISDSQKNLCPWKWDGRNLIPLPILKEFCSTSYYFILIEKIIPRLPPAVKTHLAVTLSCVEPQVHTHFPFFSFSLMRIVTLLSPSA